MFFVSIDKPECKGENASARKVLKLVLSKEGQARHITGSLGPLLWGPHLFLRHSYVHADRHTKAGWALENAMPEKAGIPALPTVIFPLPSLRSPSSRRNSLQPGTAVPALPCYAGRVPRGALGPRTQRFGGAGVPANRWKGGAWGNLGDYAEAQDLREQRRRYPEKAGLRCTPISVTGG